MGLRFRRSFNLGGFRINLSKSGVGYSFGVKGLRFTQKAGGGTRTTLHIPKTGISYVADRKKKTSESRSMPIRTEQNGDEWKEEMIESSPNELIEKINRAEKCSSSKKTACILFPILAFAFLVTAISIIANGNMVKLVFDGVERLVNGTAFVVILAILGTLSLGASIFFALQKATIELQYDLEDKTVEEKFVRLTKGLSVLRKNEKIWELLSDEDTEGAVSKIGRAEIKFIEPETYIKTNLKLTEVQLFHKKMLFLPDMLAVRQRNGWVGINYSEISVTVQEVPFEETTVPEDAEVIFKRWLHANKDGSRDWRHKDNNYEVYQCRYGGIYISSESGLGMNILCSSFEKAKEFYNAFQSYIFS